MDYAEFEYRVATALMIGNELSVSRCKDIAETAGSILRQFLLGAPRTDYGLDARSKQRIEELLSPVQESSGYTRREMRTNPDTYAAMGVSI